MIDRRQDVLPQNTLTILLVKEVNELSQIVMKKAELLPSYLKISEKTLPISMKKSKAFSFLQFISFFYYCFHRIRTSKRLHHINCTSVQFGIHCFHLACLDGLDNIFFCSILSLSLTERIPCHSRILMTQGIGRYTFY